MDKEQFLQMLQSQQASGLSIKAYCQTNGISVSNFTNWSLNDTMRYYLCPGPTCMRKGINGLCGVVHEQMGCDGFHYDDGSRAGAVIETLAKQHHYMGYLQCDGFAGYETAFRNNNNVQLVNCMAHIRRHFEQALDENRQAAEFALGEIQKLYQIERNCTETNMSDVERKQKRDELAQPIMAHLKAWMKTDHEAAGWMSVICSLIGTCKEHNVNPRMYLNDVIAKMPYVTANPLKSPAKSQVRQLLPHVWIQSHPEAKLDASNQ